MKTEMVAAISAVEYDHNSDHGVSTHLQHDHWSWVAGGVVCRASSTVSVTDLVYWEFR